MDQDASGLINTIKEMDVELSRVTTHALDIRDDAAVEKLVADIPQKFGSLDYAL